jgi:hypothetical protein
MLPPCPKKISVETLSNKEYALPGDLLKFIREAFPFQGHLAVLRCINISFGAVGRLSSVCLFYYLNTLWELLPKGGREQDYRHLRKAPYLSEYVCVCMSDEGSWRVGLLPGWE